MNEQDFLSIALLNPDILNVWYTNTSQILGLTIPVLTLESPPRNIIGILEQVQTITIPLNATGYVILTVLTRSIQSVIVAGVLKQYYFFTVTPVQGVGVQTIINNGQIILEPGYTGIDFLVSGYSVLEGSIQNQRISSYIMRSEEEKRSLEYPLLPGNINDLQAGTAQKSNTQDSLYSITGWLNGRYNGTKTDKYNYGTIDPAITGTTFKGSFFPENVSDGRIQSQSITDLIFENYFYSSIEDTPTPTLKFTGFSLLDPISNITSTLVRIFTSTNLTGSFPISPGDLITTADGSAIGSYGYLPPTTEVMQIITVTTEPPAGPDQFILRLEVKRGYSRTPLADDLPIPASTAIMKLTPTRVFKIKGSKIELVEKGKYKVKDTGEIIHVDSLGVLLQSNVGIKRI